MRILFVGGGSLGHITPSVAIWREIQQLHPGSLCHFACSEKQDDASFLTKEELPFVALPTVRLSMALPFTLRRARKQAREILQAFRPDAVFSTGGGISVPVAMEARKLHIPIVLHQCDAESGRSAQMILRWATVTTLGFPPDRDVQPRKKKERSGADRFIFTGNPVRREVMQGSRERGLRLTGLSGTRPILLVIGGSQGAQALNDGVRAHRSELLEVCDIVHLTGRGKEGKEEAPSGYFERAFAHGDLPHLYAIATLALSRAGAGTISELAVNGIPTILVPLRHLAQDHQQVNAMRSAAIGGCLKIEQKDLDTKLVSIVKDLLRFPAQLSQMAQKIHRIAAPDAAAHIARIVIDVAEKRTI